MKKVLCISLLFGLTACQNYSGTNLTDRPDKVVEVPVYLPVQPLTAQQEVAAVLAEENAYRLTLGQSMLSRGLSCVVSKFVNPTNPTTIYNSPGNTNKVGTVTNVFTYTLDGVINQPDSPISDGLNVLPAQFRSNPAYQSNYLLRCSGQLVVTETNYYEFELASDDSAILSVDGAQLINNDGSHAVTTKLGTKMLRRGVHAFKLEYLQTAGRQGLILKAGGELIDPMYLVH